MKKDEKEMIRTILFDYYSRNQFLIFYNEDHSKAFLRLYLWEKKMENLESKL